MTEHVERIAVLEAEVRELKADQAQIDAYIAACQAVKAKYTKGV